LSCGTSALAIPQRIKEGDQSVGRYPAQPTDSDGLNDARTNQRVHDGSSDPESLGGLFHCSDKGPSDLLILLKAMPG